MKVFLLLLISAFVVNQTIVLAKQHGKRIPLSKQCCNAAKTNEENAFPEKVMNAMKECRQELDTNDDQEEGKHGKFACIAECIGKKINIVNDDGSLNEDECRNFVKNELAKEDYQKAIADAAVTKCIEEAKAPSKEPAKNSKCSMALMKVSRCVETEFFKACPMDMQDKSEQCVEMRQMIESGQRPKGKRGPHPPKEDQDKSV